MKKRRKRSDSDEDDAFNFREVHRDQQSPPGAPKTFSEIMALANKQTRDDAEALKVKKQVCK